jgi:hypothetical protein
MRKIVVGAMVSIDGVMQAPGGPTEDPTRGFQVGGWVMPFFDQESSEEVDRLFEEENDRRFLVSAPRGTGSPAGRERVGGRNGAS